MIAIPANQACAEPTGGRAYIERDQNSLVGARKTSLTYMCCASSPGFSKNALWRNGLYIPLHRRLFAVEAEPGKEKGQEPDSSCSERSRGNRWSGSNVPIRLVLPTRPLHQDACRSAQEPYCIRGKHLRASLSQLHLKPAFSHHDIGSDWERQSRNRPTFKLDLRPTDISLLQTAVLKEYGYVEISKLLHMGSPKNLPDPNRANIVKLCHVGTISR
jgi:hypothetical protein